jgi:hypothetical protein
MPDPSHGGSPLASASVASTLPLVAPLLRPLTHEDLSGSSASDLTMSFWAPTPAVVAPLVVPLVVPPVGPPVVPLPPIPAPAPPVANVAQQAPAIIPPSLAPVSLLCPAKPFKLPAIADAKAYLNNSSIIQYYLHCPEFSTQRSDIALITDFRNAKASAYWEGQVRVAVQDGFLHFPFENKGSMYNGKGFKMLSALNEHCHSNSITNAFTTLMSLFNDSMGKSEEIMVFLSQFNGMVNDMAQCKIVIPPILMVMFFLCSLHPCYDDLLEQFCSRYKSLDGASLDSIVADVWYHNEFKLVGLDKKLPPGRNPWAAAASAPPASDWQGKEWNNPYNGYPSSILTDCETALEVISHGKWFLSHLSL